jgi:hypothetical protein
MPKIIDSKDRRSLILVDTNTVLHHVLDAIGVGAGAITNAVERVYPVAGRPIAPGLDGGRNVYAAAPPTQTSTR